MLTPDGAGATVAGMLMVALSRSGRCSGWAQLDPAATTTASYRPAISSWAVTNATAAPDLTLTMVEAAPTAGVIWGWRCDWR